MRFVDDDEVVVYENNTPEFIYYKTLFHIFEKFLGDAGKTDADLGKTSLFETEVWKALFEFQKDGAKGAINKIIRHNGCIIADSVGLGKTYEALAVMKYFELKNERVLVLCPKKLRDNWTVGEFQPGGIDDERLFLGLVGVKAIDEGGFTEKEIEMLNAFELFLQSIVGVDRKIGRDDGELRAYLGFRSEKIGDGSPGVIVAEARTD